jgi:hypothetical protein
MQAQPALASEGVQRALGGREIIGFKCVEGERL